MVSVLLPSRNRSAMCEKSIHTLGSKDVEILIYVDYNDPDLASYILLGNDFTTIVIGPRYTYKKLHEYYNLLSKMAKGDWLMLWNDDAEMLTYNWTDKLPAVDKPMVVNFNENPLDNLFPVISRQMYETMGHFSLSPHNDSWVQDIANELGIHTYIPGVQVKHLRDIIEDDTKKETQSAYSETSPLHYSHDIQELMQIDIQKIKEKL